MIIGIMILDILLLLEEIFQKKKGKNELKFATDLIKVLKKKFDFEITVSAYPEKHPDSKSIEQEYDILKMKIDLGA